MTDLREESSEDVHSTTGMELFRVSRVFRGGQGVHDVSLVLKSQAIHGMIGANGSGKSTLLALMAGQQFPDSGQVLYGGIPVHEHAHTLSNICLVKTHERSWENYTLKQIFSFAALLYPNWDAGLAGELMDKFQLNAKKKYKQLSRGGQSMAGIIKGMASRAPLTLLDEPVIGLDASMREIFYKALLADYSMFPRTFVMTTHLIDESENLFEYMTYIKKGNVAYHGPVEDLSAKASYLTGTSSLLEELTKDKRTLHVERLGGRLLLALEDLSDPSERKHWLDKGVELSPISLQKLFVYMTQRDAANNEREGNR
ncbi:ABC transporter ATP-binding protein [Paenibacillus wynnii]|uniref:ABC transporter domain-containing protein n=1 Tax=Paenibacillus wynnii TaxID=268407 RepID=A0A098MDX3_9BACL|nr:ABC transporter ATP-binding protein [Paenibacillus wynnii]KGE20765.1 hypothetical protein PWYN_00875 [Paenibacillus wynnii]